MAEKDSEKPVSETDLMREIEKLNRNVEALSRDTATLYKRVHPHKNEIRDEVFAQVPTNAQIRRILESGKPVTIRSLYDAIKGMGDCIRAIEYDFNFVRSRLNAMEDAPDLRVDLQGRLNRPKGTR